MVTKTVRALYTFWSETFYKNEFLTTHQDIRNVYSELGSNDCLIIKMLIIKRYTGGSVTYRCRRSSEAGAGCRTLVHRAQSSSSRLSPLRRCSRPPMTRTTSASSAALLDCPFQLTGLPRWRCPEWTGSWSLKWGQASTCFRCPPNYSFSPHNSSKMF